MDEEVEMEEEVEMKEGVAMRNDHSIIIWLKPFHIPKSSFRTHRKLIFTCSSG